MCAHLDTGVWVSYNTNMITENDLRLAWIAGFIDGEGSVMITRTTSRSKAWNGPGRRLVVTAVQAKSHSSLAVLQMLRDLFGGSVHKVQRSLGDYQYWVWQITGVGAAKCLREILPYLRLKRRQAVDGLRFYAIHSYFCPQGYGSRNLPTKARTVMLRLADRVGKLNRPSAVRKQTGIDIRESP